MDNDDVREDTAPRRHPHLSRRAVITGAGVAVLAGAAGVYATVRTAAESTAASPTAAPRKPPAPRRFETTDLSMPPLTSWKTGTTGAGLVFVTQQVTGFRGAIVQEDGEPVWIEPTGANLTDLKVQSYQGQPVVTYWVGKSSGGYGAGEGVILDASYSEVARVAAGNGVEADLHEFTLTDRGTALLTVYEAVPADLRSIGGPARGHILDCRVQEVEVSTGRVLFDWKALDHIPVADTYFGLGQDEGHDGTSAQRAFDPYHLNSVDDDGSVLLVSARHTHAVYALDRASGDVRWRFGGKHSDLAMDEDAVFAWQHDARRQPDGTISLFDNHLVDEGKGRSRAMVFRLDETAGSATLEREYTYDDHLGVAMGSAQLLPGGNVLVGWGTDPAVTEFTKAGEAVWEARLGGISYRARRHEWVAHPRTSPDVAAKPEGGETRVFASWNGATDVRRWRVVATSSGEPAFAGEVQRSGFETSMLVPRASRVAVQALDANGAVLGVSRTIPVAHQR